MHPVTSTVPSTAHKARQPPGPTPEGRFPRPAPAAPPFPASHRVCHHHRADATRAGRRSAQTTMPVRHRPPRRRPRVADVSVATRGEPPGNRGETRRELDISRHNSQCLLPRQCLLADWHVASISRWCRREAQPRRLDMTTIRTFSAADADRLLRLADQFLLDWAETAHRHGGPDDHCRDRAPNGKRSALCCNQRPPCSIF